MSKFYPTAGGAARKSSGLIETGWSEAQWALLNASLQNLQNPASASASLRPAAVALCLYAERGRLYGIFIHRARHYRRDGRETVHSGQIGLPGGKREPGESLLETAVRETREEIALDLRGARRLGEIGPIATFVSGFSTTAFVYALDERPELRREPSEVAAIYHVPVSDLLRQHPPTFDFNSRIDRIALHYHWQPPQAEPICIWGMTARITWQLLNLVAAIRS